METQEERTRRIFVDQHEKRLFRNIKKAQEGKNDNVTKARFLTLIREQVDGADSKLHDCLSTNKHKPDCYIDYGRNISTANDIIENTRSFGNNKSFYLPCIPEMLDEETRSIIEETNEKIKERTSYGTRNELAEHNSIILRWSDSSKAWHPTDKAKKSQTVKLDANMILLKETKDKAKLGHAASCLQNLPLYRLSFEAIHQRKETPLLQGIATWVERQLQKEKEMIEREKYA